MACASAPAQDSKARDLVVPTGSATPPFQLSEKIISAKEGETPDKIVEYFFALLTRNQIDQAYDYLTNGTKIGEKPEEVANLKTKTRDAIRIFGEILGYESVGVKNVGTRLLRANYISIGKGFPLRWKFYFYRWDKTWRLIDIGVDDRLVDMFDEKAAATPVAGKNDFP
jgi:hypothetical protein